MCVSLKVKTFKQNSVYRCLSQRFYHICFEEMNCSRTTDYTYCHLKSFCLPLISRFSRVDLLDLYSTPSWQLLIEREFRKVAQGIDAFEIPTGLRAHNSIAQSHLVELNQSGACSIRPYTQLCSLKVSAQGVGINKTPSASIPLHLLYSIPPPLELRPRMGAKCSTGNETAASQSAKCQQEVMLLISKSFQLNLVCNV